MCRRYLLFLEPAHPLVQTLLRWCLLWCKQRSIIIMFYVHMVSNALFPLTLSLTYLIINDSLNIIHTRSHTHSSHPLNPPNPPSLSTLSTLRCERVTIGTRTPDIQHDKWTSTINSSATTCTVNLTQYLSSLNVIPPYQAGNTTPSLTPRQSTTPDSDPTTTLASYPHARTPYCCLPSCPCFIFFLGNFLGVICLPSSVFFLIFVDCLFVDRPRVRPALACILVLLHLFFLLPAFLFLLLQLTYTLIALLALSHYIGPGLFVYFFLSLLSFSLSHDIKQHVHHLTH